MAQALLQMAHVSHEAQVARLTAPLARKVVIRKFNLEKLESTKIKLQDLTVFAFKVLSTF